MCFLVLFCIVRYESRNVLFTVCVYANNLQNANENVCSFVCLTRYILVIIILHRTN